MRELDLLVRGILAGLIIAVPVGPVNVLCVQRTLAKGLRSGLVSGLGAAVVDALYGAVAGFSITFVISFLIREEFWIRLFGGILLAGIGVSYFFKRPVSLETGKDRGSERSDFTSTLLLNLANPTTVLSFLAILATLGTADSRRWWLTVFLIAGVFCGSMAWWITLSLLVNRFREHFDRKILLWTNRIAGLAIGGFGIAAFVLRGNRG